MKKFFNLLFAFLKKEASWVKGAFFESTDEIQLSWRNQEIKDYNLKLDWITEDEKLGFDVVMAKKDVEDNLQAALESRDTIFARINAREAWHSQKQAVAH